MCTQLTRWTSSTAGEVDCGMDGSDGGWFIIFPVDRLAVGDASALQRDEGIHSYGAEALRGFRATKTSRRRILPAARDFGGASAHFD